MIDWFIAVAAGYLLGSVSGSLLLGKWRGVDIRQHGSGNAGGTNALRTQGWIFALGVVVIDIGKGAAAVWLTRQLVDPSSVPLALFAAAIAAILGHMFPLYHGFRGGKGAATYIGTLLALAPASLPIILAVWLVVVVLTGYVGLSTMTAAASGVAALAALHRESGQWMWVAFAGVAALLIIAAHADNIRRMRTGTENRFEKIRIKHWRKSK